MKTSNSLPSDGAASDDFGWSIAIDNGIVAVGARLDDDNGDNSGSAYLFDATTGQQLHKLLPSDGAAGDFFGYSIAIANGVVAVGASGLRVSVQRPPPANRSTNSSPVTEQREFRRVYRH